MTKLSPKQREALAYFVDGPRQSASFAGGTLLSLQRLGLLVISTMPVFPRTYATTDAGRAALSVGPAK